ncbi:HAAAP family serine/threonine permease [Bowdeniella nasicola]|uniref:HAAAP family serine/threonine permease n=1 Tax=Bowdeniella nasicola TaxID=208480 RepID=A0A1Q5Q1D2_9ACTO|nr:HAAAP family serine/threonine permease [Bowdeniella nasicola]
MEAPELAEKPLVTPEEKQNPKIVNRSWVISLFGTAVGAGVLFLPINAGAGGVWPLLIVTLLIGPMTYFSHRALARFVCVSPRKGEDITLVAADYFGDVAGKVITVLYFFAIYPIVLIYGVGITNTLDSLIVNQLGGPQIPRVILSGVAITLLMIVMLVGQRIMLIVTQVLVYPLIALLFGISLYLIPSWSLSGLKSPTDFGGMMFAVWLVIPVLVFAFNHSPAISQFSLAMQRTHGEAAAENASKVLIRTAALLVGFTMFFVWSCVLALGSDGLAAAREANLPVLSHLANVHGTPIIAYLGPAIAIAAIGSSFFGHYLGAAEGAAGIVRTVAPKATAAMGNKKLSLYIAAFMFLTTWAAAIINPSILGLIESLSGPVIASILYLMPMYAIYQVDALKPYRKQASNIFVIIAGIVAVSGVAFSLFR